MGGVPGGPVGVGLSCALLVLAVGKLRPSKGRRQVACRTKRGRVALDPPGQSGRDLLQQPLIAVGVAERSPGEVAPPLRVGTLDGAARAEVEDLAHLDTGA